MKKGKKLFVTALICSLVAPTVTPATHALAEQQVPKTHQPTPQARTFILDWLLFGGGYKRAARNQLKELLNLTEAARVYFSQLIGSCNSRTEIRDVLDQARELDEAFEDATGEIQGLENLSSTEVNIYLSQLRGAKNINEVNAILNSAKKTNSDNGKNVDDLADAKIKAAAKIEALSNLTADEIKKYETYINEAQSQDTINAVLEIAQNLNDSRKDSGNTDLNLLRQKVAIQLATLLAGQASLATYQDRLSKATTEDEINEILKEAVQESEAIKQDLELQGNKETATATINNLKYLTAVEKNEIVQSINNAKDKDSIDKILVDAQAKDNTAGETAHFNALKQDAIAEIEALTHLLYADKKEYEDKVSAAKDYDEVVNLLAEVEQKDGEAAQKELDLDQVKAQGKESVDGLEKLSKTEKQDYEDRISSATDFLGVSNAVLEATVINTQRTDNEAALAALAEGKALAASIVDSLSSLTDSQKEAAKQKIDDATTISELITAFAQVEADNTQAVVQAAVDKAIQQEDSKNLVTLKKELVSEIDAMKGLTDDAKQQIEEKIYETQDLESLSGAINEILTSEAASSNGDFNHDGVVNGADLSYLISIINNNKAK